MSETLIRRTWSVCPECLEELRPGRGRPRDGLPRKDCPEHGTSECLLAPCLVLRSSGSLLLRRHVPRRSPAGLPDPGQRALQPPRPICLASAVDSKEGPPPTPDMDLERLEAFMDTHPRGALKIDLISAEPTLRKDLPEILRAIKSRGHISSLHTNGVRLADREYLRTLKNAGLDEVFLQMDGFDDQAYLKIRGARLTHTKIRVLENLEAEGVATSLVMVVMPGCNEAEIPKVLDYAATRPFIREVMFLGTRALGTSAAASCYAGSGHDLVEDLAAIVPRPEVFRSRTHFALLSLGVRKYRTSSTTC